MIRIFALMTLGGVRIILFVLIIDAMMLFLTLLLTVDEEKFLEILIIGEFLGIVMNTVLAPLVRGLLLAWVD